MDWDKEQHVYRLLSKSPRQTGPEFEAGGEEDMILKKAENKACMCKPCSRRGALKNSKKGAEGMGGKICISAVWHCCQVGL